MNGYIISAMMLLDIDYYKYQSSYLTLLYNGEYRTVYLNPLYIENTDNPVDTIIHELSWRLK